MERRGSAGNGGHGSHEETNYELHAKTNSMRVGTHKCEMICIFIILISILVCYPSVQPCAVKRG